MKVFISVDMEGIAGVTHSRHADNEHPEYQRARKWMTGEANAAIEGALAAGATEIVVADSHSSMDNLLPEELNEAAQLVRGAPRPLSMMHGLDDTFDAVLLVGYHARAGSATGVIAHTYTGAVYNVRLNGITVGESGLNAALAGNFGVPVALVCGDDALAAEVGEVMPWAERVIVKWAINAQSARNLTPGAAQKRIRDGAKRALERLPEMKPLILKQPIRLEIDFKQPLHAQIAAEIPGVTRLAERTVAYTGNDALEAIRMFRLMMRVIAD